MKHTDHASCSDVTFANDLNVLSSLFCRVLGARTNVKLMRTGSGT